MDCAFLLVARAGDHPHLQAQLDRSDAPWFADPSPEGQERDRQLRVVPEVELNAANPDLKVQVLQSSERRGSGEDARRAFTWVTDLPLNPHNASELARAARSRWKIENETFNTLKNVQYLEHNFGHGTQHLSDTFAALMLLAFLIDQLLQSSERRGSGEDARRAFTWVTDLPLNPHNASELARAARSRWKIENETFNTLKNVQYLEHNFGHGNPAPVGYFRCADAAGVPDRPAAGNGLPRHEANLRQVLYPNRNVGTSAQQFLCGSLPQLAGTVRPRPRGSTPRTSPTIRPDGRPPLQLLDEEGIGTSSRGPMPP